VLTGETVRVDDSRLPVGRAFAEFPCALLHAGGCIIGGR
jgi:hypothetical protein